MLVLVQYKNNAMENYKIICIDNNIIFLNEKLHNLRKLNKNCENIFYRIIRL